VSVVLVTGLDRGFGSMDMAVEELEVKAGGGRTRAEDGRLAGTRPQGQKGPARARPASLSM
jgi:hypothetical protein